jgi:uncharacterized protein YoxC
MSELDQRVRASENDILEIKITLTWWKRVALVVTPLCFLFLLGAFGLTLKTLHDSTNEALQDERVKELRAAMREYCDDAEKLFDNIQQLSTDAQASADGARASKAKADQIAKAANDLPSRVTVLEADVRKIVRSVSRIYSEAAREYNAHPTELPRAAGLAIAAIGQGDSEKDAVKDERNALDSIPH